MGETVNLAPATFTDKGTLDTHTASIDWGDGASENGIVTESPFGPPGSLSGLPGSVSGSHSYSSSGTYTVEVCVTDDDNSTNCDSFTVNITVAGPGASMSLLPSSTSVSVGSTFTLDIQVAAGSQLVDSAEVYIDFDPTVLEVQDSDPNTLGVQIQPLTLTDFIPVNTADNTLGEISYNAGGFTAVSGTFTLATVTFKAISMPSNGSADIAFSMASPRGTNLYRAGNSVNPALSDAAISIVQPTVRVVFRFQGSLRPAPQGWEKDVTVKFFSGGVEVLTVNSLSSYDAASGTAYIETAGVAPGVYDITIVGPSTLSNIKRNVTVATTPQVVDLGTLLSGDGSGDDQITIIDFSILSGSFGLTVVDASFDARADYDGNGSITIADFSLLSGNFGKTGPVEVP